MILNEYSPEGAIIKLGEHDRIPMYTIAMPPLFPYKVTAPDTLYLKRMLIGLLEAFPSYSQDFFLYYLYTKEGVQDHYTIAQLAQIVLKQNERPMASGMINRNSSGLCEKDSDEESSPVTGNKENVQREANSGKGKKTSVSPAECKETKAKEVQGVLSIEKSLSYFTPMLSRMQPGIPNENRSLNERVPSASNGVYVVDRMKANLLKQIEESAGIHTDDKFLAGLGAHPLLFSAEERSESLNDEDYEYTQLNTSTMKELSDLEKDSQAEGAKKGANTERLKQTVENIASQPERASCLITQDLYCPENINELFKSHSFATQS